MHTHTTHDQTGAPALSYEPSFDLMETSAGFILRADVPGVKPDGVELSIDRGELKLLAKAHPRAAEGRVLREEYGVGDYHLQIRLPGPVEPGAASAKLVDGVLTVTLPKPSELQPRRITVNAAKPQIGPGGEP